MSRSITATDQGAAEPAGPRTQAMRRGEEALKRSHREDSEARQARVLAAIQEILISGTPVTVSLVAHEAQVSRSMVDKHARLMQAVDNAKDVQKSAGVHGARKPRHGAAALDALATDLAQSKERIRELSAQVAGYRQQDRLATGVLLAGRDHDQAGYALREATRQAASLRSDVVRLARAVDERDTRIRALEEDLAAAHQVIGLDNTVVRLDRP